MFYFENNYTLDRIEGRRMKKKNVIQDVEWGRYGIVKNKKKKNLSANTAIFQYAVVTIV